VDFSAMPMDELRVLRARSRREAELVRLRSRQDGARTDANGDLEELQARVDMLTSELIARYAADLSLVDSLLGEAYPAQVTRKAAR
jgi:hypothetical protein